MAEGQSGETLSGWLEAINDQRLQTLVEEALSANPEIDAAQARLNRARAILSQSRAAQRPSLSADGRATVSEGFDGGADTTGYSVALNASWEADLWGRLSSARRADARLADAAEADSTQDASLIAAQKGTNQLLASIAQSVFTEGVAEPYYKRDFVALEKCCQDV